MKIRNCFARIAPLLVAIVVLAAAAVAGEDDQAIIANTRKYLAAQSYPPGMKVTVEKVVGDYARVAIAPKDPKMDGALVFLKRDHGVWKGLTVGTGWDPEELAKMHIPASLRP
jgi:hypothetical protein